MFIIWQGWGFLTAVIPLIAFIIAELIVSTLKISPIHHNQYALSIALLLSAVAIWFVGRKLNGAPGKTLIDPETNETVILKKKHTLFWIPMQYYAILLLLLFVVVLLTF